MEQYIIKENDGNDSIFILVPNFLDSKNLTKMKSELRNIDDWKITAKYDKTTIQRKQKWYQVDNKPFGKNWKKSYDRWKPNNYSEYLLKFQNNMQNIINEIIDGNDSISKPKINSLLINYYEDGNNCITAHQDDKGSFGLEPTIALLSIDGPRTFCLERTICDSLKRDKENSYLNRNFVLPDNSLFIMAGGSQRYFCHSIQEEPSNKNSRYSLTFREFIY